MSRMFSRLAGGLAASILAGAVLMLTAAPAGAVGSTVSFDGSSPLGLSALACNSTPDRTAVSLTTADTLNVENLTGRNAAIYLNGSKSGSTVGPNQGVPITFPVGAWTVSLVPDCLLNLSDAGSVKVTVVAPVVAALPAPAIPPASTGPGSSKSGTTNTTTTSATTSAGTPRSGSTASVKPTASVSPSVKKHESKQSPSATPTASAKAAKHGTSGSAPGGTGGNDPFAQPSTPSAQAGGPIAGVNIGDARALPAADTVASGPSYLLVVIAFILVAGVGWAAVRALFTQRRARRMAAYSGV